MGPITRTHAKTHARTKSIYICDAVPFEPKLEVAL